MTTSTHGGAACRPVGDSGVPEAAGCEWCIVEDASDTEGSRSNLDLGAATRVGIPKRRRYRDRSPLTRMQSQELAAGAGPEARAGHCRLNPGRAATWVSGNVGNGSTTSRLAPRSSKSAFWSPMQAMTRLESSIGSIEMRTRHACTYRGCDRGVSCSSNVKNKAGGRLFGSASGACGAENGAASCDIHDP